MLDNTMKTVSLISAVMAVLVSAASFFIDSRLKASDAELRAVKQSVEEADNKTRAAIARLEADAKMLVAQAQVRAATVETAAAEMKNKKDEFELAARLQVSFGLPLARAFAINFSTHNQDFAMPTTEFSDEIRKVLPGWQARKELMTGDACGPQGLLARQVITLEIRNVGATDAENITVRFVQKATPHAESTKGWQEMSPQRKPVQYYDIIQDGSGWKSFDMIVRNLPGSRNADKTKSAFTVVLASVSGGTWFYGTVFVPVEISWSDPVTNKRQTAQIIEPEKPMLRSGLTGAEIGSVRSTC